MSTHCPPRLPLFFFFNDTATTEIYTLSLHDALPISSAQSRRPLSPNLKSPPMIAAESSVRKPATAVPPHAALGGDHRSEEHTSELQSRLHLVCRLLLEKKKNHI